MFACFRTSVSMSRSRAAGDFVRWLARKTGAEVKGPQLNNAAARMWPSDTTKPVTEYQVST